MLGLQKLWDCYLVEVLHQDLPVRHKLVWSQAVMVKVSEGGVADDSLLDSLKSGLIAGIPGEVSIFSQEFSQRGGQSGQATDEGAEVCHHAEELLDFSDIYGCWESMDSIDLLWVQVDTIGIV